MEHRAAVAVSDCQHADLDGNLSVLALVLNVGFRQVGCGDELTHERIILDDDIVNQADDFGLAALRRCFHEVAEERYLRLRNRAAEGETCGGAAQQPPDGDRCA